jgi:hypothetical protein
MPETLDYDGVLKTVLSWPRRDQAALVQAIVNDLAAIPSEPPAPAEKPAPVPRPAPLYVPLSPPTPPAIAAPTPKIEGARPWVDETST